MKYFFPLLFFANGLAAQSTGWDTTRYQKFSRNLIVGIFQSYRNFENQFNPLPALDSGNIAKHKYIAESKLVTGIELSYDKFALSFAIRSTPQDQSAGKGRTDALNFNFNLGGNIWFVENSFRYFKGFYDEYSPRYDSTFKETGTYFLQPNFTNVLGRSKFMYFTNHKKYSFRSNYASNYRQVKSAGTWVISANAHYNYLQNDSSFFPRATRNRYGDMANLKGLNVFAISAYGGGAFTLVLWRAFFINMMLVMGPEPQWREYHYPNKTVKLSYLSISGDFRSSIGLNFKRLYFISFSSNDFVLYDSSFMKLQNKSISGGFILGWRFNSHTPEFYKRIQATKLYKAL